MTPWQSKCHRWLEENAAKAYHNWCESKAGKRWKARKRRVSPYYAGFSLPDYHHDLIAALGRNDEETCKSIMMYEGE